MKPLSLSILALASCVLPAFAAVPPLEVVGNYQALLYTTTDNVGMPAGLVTLAVTKTGAATGKLTTDENKIYSFTTKVDYTADAVPDDDLLGTATQMAPIEIKRPKMASIFVGFSILNKTSAGQVFQVVVSSTGVEPRVSDSGFKQAVYAVKTPAPFMGKYTLAFELETAPPAGSPEGSGYALGTVSNLGILALTGKTGDGVAFTASLPAGPDRNFVAYLNPYKTPGSVLAGKIKLTPRTTSGFHHVPAADPDVDFHWKKAPKTTDTAFKLGFGPLRLLLTMEPWNLVPKLPVGQTLGTMLGLTPDKVFNLAFQGGFSTATYATKVPLTLSLNQNNTLRVASGHPDGPPVAVPTSWAPVFSGKVDPLTGKITATLTLTDVVPAAPPPSTKTKVVTRKLTIEGVMLQLEAGDSSPFAQGFVLVPPVDPKTSSTQSGAFGFNGPVVTDPFIALAGATAGNYTVKVYQLIEYDLDGFTGNGITVNITGKLSGIPANASVVPFTIAPNLSYITFNGRKVPLRGDSRPVALVFSDATATNYRNTLTVEVFLNTSTGLPTAVVANYIQVLAAKITTALPPPIGNRTVAGLVPGLAIYAQNEVPIKVP